MAEFDGLAMYLKIAERIKNEIDSGSRVKGSKIPSESELMKEDDVSRTVARQAIARLREDGYVISHQGKGSFVSDPSERKERKSPEYAQITEHLDEVLRDVRKLAKRMDHLEELVRSQMPKP
ncbi:GntR family transcriptional regulator [Streptomyces fractus]|uniref:GntR family transcriptional regulator n=1 Tax=Streptomyces fractus TaxID=641806 RepID=UPI003CE8D774